MKGRGIEALAILKLWGIEPLPGGLWRQGNKVADSPEEAAALFRMAARKSPITCVSCGHTYGFHLRGECRIKDCDCTEYVDPNEFELNVEEK